MFASIYCQHIPAELSVTPAAGPTSRSLPEFAYAFSPLVEEVAPKPW